MQHKEIGRYGEAILIIESADYPLTLKKIEREVKERVCHLDFVIGTHPSGYRRVVHPLIDFGVGPAVWPRQQLKKAIRVFNKLYKQGHLPTR